MIQPQLEQNEAQKDGHENFLVNAIYNDAVSTQASNRIFPNQKIVDAGQRFQINMRFRH